VLRTPTANHRMALMSAGFTGIHRWCVKYNMSGIVGCALCSRE
jgi:TM2 domain-containing membrane protein YozV